MSFGGLSIFHARNFDDGTYVVHQGSLYVSSDIYAMLRKGLKKWPSFMTEFESWFEVVRMKSELKRGITK